MLRHVFKQRVILCNRMRFAGCRIYRAPEYTLYIRMIFKSITKSIFKSSMICKSVFMASPGPYSTARWWRVWLFVLYSYILSLSCYCTHAISVMTTQNCTHFIRLGSEWQIKYYDTISFWKVTNKVTVLILPKLNNTADRKPPCLLNLSATNWRTGKIKFNFW